MNIALLDTGSDLLIIYIVTCSVRECIAYNRVTLYDVNFIEQTVQWVPVECHLDNICLYTASVQCPQWWSH